MIELSKLKLLKSTDEINPNYKMPFDEFCETAKKVLPNFPEDVLSQWPYENYPFFLDFANQGMKYDEFTFKKESWNLGRILEIQDPSKYFENGIGHFIIDNVFETDLSRYMREYRTWPRPIIVFDTIRSKTDGTYPFEKPYHLLEGHMRFALLKHMIQVKWDIPNIHIVWVATQE